MRIDISPFLLQERFRLPISAIGRRLQGWSLLNLLSKNRFFSDVNFLKKWEFFE